MTKDVQQAIIDILQYIQKHPNAKHTKEGIVKNWIYQQRLEEKIDVAEAAINYLMRDGIFKKLEKADKRGYLIINNKKINEISAKVAKFKVNCK